jgi:signal transduction histidine kinase
VRHARAHSLDLVVPLLVGGLIAVGIWFRVDGSARLHSLLIGLSAAATLVVRRRMPTLALALAGALVLVLFAVNRPSGSIAVIAPAAALYTLALTRDRRHLVVAVAAAATAVVLGELFLGGGHARGIGLPIAAHVALIAIPVLAAEALRNHRGYVRLLRERADFAERTREEEAQRRAEQERLRIARDLHDVVAHTLTTINVQAGVAAHLLERDATPARDALATIEAASHDALDELRSILGVLRQPGDTAAPRSPAPDLDALGPLLEQARRGGLDVAFTATGTKPAPLAEGVQLAGFRIIQEALTNARRHASGTETDVRLAYLDDRLAISIENPIRNGEPNGSHPDGVGILGMQERARALGGTLTAGRDDGVFRVVAELPYRRSA